MRKSSKSDDGQVSRRGYVTALIGAGLAGLAGCSGTSNDGGATSAGESTNGGTNSETATAGDTDSETTNSKATTHTGNPQSDTVSVPVNNVPAQSNLNPWGKTTKGTGSTYITDLTAPQHIQAGDYLLSGETFKAPWIDGSNEITVATTIEDVTVNPPYDWKITQNSDMKYWDGTPIDAKARNKHNKVRYANLGYKFSKGSTYNHEVVDQWTYHSWRDKGKAKNQTKDPTNKRILKSQAYGTNQASLLPFHPDFTTPWVQKYADASSEDAVKQVTENLAGEQVTFGKFADNGWGSGLYRVESSDDVSNQAMNATMWEDHPNAGHATIPNLKMQFASGDRRSLLINQGKVDIGRGHVEPESGAITRTSLPDHIQQIQTWRQIGGDQVMINWNNKHLGRLWFRRALVAAIDWVAVKGNGWGPQHSAVSKHQVGLLDTVAEQVFSSDFLEKMHTYPAKSDTELAKKYLKKGGYEKQNGSWVGPDGNKASFGLHYYGPVAEYVAATQTIKGTLENFGISTGIKGVPQSAFSKAMKPGNEDFDVMMTWGGNANVWDSYWSNGHWYQMGFLSGDPNDDPGKFVVDATDGGSQTRDTHDTLGRPLQPQVPTNVGSIEAPEQAGTNPKLENGKQIDLAELIHAFRKADISDEEWQETARKCARWYNYYLPDFLFHQYNWGLWGNVRDFTFPGSGKEANKYKKFDVDDFEMLGGIPQLKYDSDYEKP